MSATFEVIVGNVGCVYTGNNERDAMLNARVYANHSKDGRGRVSGEPVTVLRDGTIIKEYEPARNGRAS